MLNILRAASSGLRRVNYQTTDNRHSHLATLLYIHSRQEPLALGAGGEGLLRGGVGAPVLPGGEEGRVYVVRSHAHHGHPRPARPELVLHTPQSEYWQNYLRQGAPGLTPAVLVRAVTACLEAV